MDGKASGAIQGGLFARVGHSCLSFVQTHESAVLEWANPVENIQECYELNELSYISLRYNASFPRKQLERALGGLRNEIRIVWRK